MGLTDHRGVFRATQQQDMLAVGEGPPGAAGRPGLWPKQIPAAESPHSISLSTDKAELQSQPQKKAVLAFPRRAKCCAKHIKDCPR